MKRVVWVLLLAYGSVFATATEVGACAKAGAAWIPAGEDAGALSLDEGLVMLALQHFLEKRPGRWDGQNFMVRYMELSAARGPRVCGEPPVGAWGGLGSFLGDEHACNAACLADPRCAYAVFQVENGECTGFAECSIAATVANKTGTFIVNERTAYACGISPSWCGACKRAGLSAAAADSCRVISGEWHCAGVATCVAAGGTEESSGSCTPDTLVCAGRAGQLGSGLEQAAAVLAALDVRDAHPACPRFAPALVLREAARRAAATLRSAEEPGERREKPGVEALRPERPRQPLAAAQLGGGLGDGTGWSSDHYPDASRSKDALEWTIASLRNEVQMLRQTLNAKEDTDSLGSQGKVTSEAHDGAATASAAEALQNASMSAATTQRACTAADKAAMNPKWLQDGSRLEQMCSVYSPPPEYKSMGDMPPPAMWKPEDGTPECCDAGQSCEVAGFRILENYLTLYSLCVPQAKSTGT